MRNPNWFDFLIYRLFFWWWNPILTENKRLRDFFKNEVEQRWIYAEMHNGTYPIPYGIYYNEESDNFYDSESRNGMGMNFYEEWKDRRGEFPKSAEEVPCTLKFTKPPYSVHPL